jgi:short-chain fatty acids transporter
LTGPRLDRTRARLPGTIMALQGDANGVLSKATAFFVNIFERWMPDSFVVAVVLTLLTFLLSVTAAGFGPGETLVAWGNGFWGLLAFANQIVLTLIFGYAVALTPPVNRLLKWIAAKPKTPTGVDLLVGFIGGVTALLSWGLSLVAGAIMACFTGAECLRRGVRAHYPLLVASGFSGFVVWHQGLSRDRSSWMPPMPWVPTLLTSPWL